MKKILAFALLIMLCNETLAQNIFFSNLDNSELYYNPAFAGRKIRPRFTSSYVNRWPEAQNSSNIFLMSYDQFFHPLNSGIGLTFLQQRALKNDKSLSDIRLTYSFPIALTGRFKLRIGTGIGFVTDKYDRNNLDAGFEPRRRFYNSERLNNKYDYTDFSLGLIGERETYAEGKSYVFGIGFDHITQPKECSDCGREGRLPIKTTAFIKGRFHKIYPSQNFVTALPAIVFQMQNGRFKNSMTNNYEIEPYKLVYMKLDLKKVNKMSIYNKGGVIVGAGYRYMFEHPSTTTFSIGFERKAWTVSYQYGNNIIGERVSIPGNTHEIGLKYQAPPPKLKRYRPPNPYKVYQYQNRAY